MHLRILSTISGAAALAIALASALAASPPALALTHRGSSHGTPSGRLTVRTSPSAHAAVTPGTRIAANIELGPCPPSSAWMMSWAATQGFS